MFVHVETELTDDSLGQALLSPLGGVVTEDGGIGEAEFEAWVDDVHARAEAGEFFFALNQYLFVAEKPDEVG